MVGIVVVNSSFPLTLTCERSNVVFKYIFFCLISNQSLSLHIEIVIKFQKKSKSVDMLKYKFISSIWNPDLNCTSQIYPSFSNIKHELILTLTLLIENQMII